MPHLTLQLSGNLTHAADALLDAAVSTCQASGHFTGAVIMARAVVHERYRVAQQGATGFADMVLRIRAGRSAQTRTALSAQIAAALAGVLQRLSPDVLTCLTCEIDEIDVDTRTLVFTGITP